MSSNCPECRAISRELANVFGKAAEAVDNIDPAVLQRKLGEWRCWFVDGDLNGKNLPTIAPEILDPRLHKPDSPFAQAFRRKLEHEQRTGHKIKFPPEL